MPTIDSAFRDVTQTLSAHLASQPDDPRALFLAALVIELVNDAPRPLREAARRAPATAPGCQGAVVAMWRDLVKHEAMTPARATALAKRLTEVLEHPAALAFLAEEAEPHHEAAELLRAAVRRRFPGFDLETPSIDQGVLLALGVPLETPGVTLRLHADGQVALLAALDTRLAIAAPGRARFVDRGVRRGSGWAVDETYARGCARGEFFSPWHDGTAYEEPTPWLTWVAKAAMSVCLAAGTSPGKPARRTRQRQPSRGVATRRLPKNAVSSTP